MIVARMEAVEVPGPRGAEKGAPVEESGFFAALLGERLEDEPAEDEAAVESAPIAPDPPPADTPRAGSEAGDLLLPLGVGLRVPDAPAEAESVEARDPQAPRRTSELAGRAPGPVSSEAPAPANEAGAGASRASQTLAPEVPSGTEEDPASLPGRPLTAPARPLPAPGLTSQDGPSEGSLPPESAPTPDAPSSASSSPGAVARAASESGARAVEGETAASAAASARPPAAPARADERPPRRSSEGGDRSHAGGPDRDRHADESRRADATSSPPLVVERASSEPAPEPLARAGVAPVPPDGGDPAPRAEPAPGAPPVGAPAAPTAPAAPPGAPERAAAGAPTPPAALPESIEWLAARGGGSARIRLHPPHLGEIDLRVKVRNGLVQIQVVAHERAAHGVIEANRDLLMQGLAARDLRVDSFQVSTSSDGQSAGDFDARGGLGARSGFEGRQEAPFSRPPGEGAGRGRVGARSAVVGNEPNPASQGARTRTSVDLRI